MKSFSPTTFFNKKSPSQSNPGIIKAGYLNKQGGNIKTWKKRWFVLHTDHLGYYKTQKDPKEVGRIPLECVAVMEDETLKNSFSISPQAGSTLTRTYIVTAESTEEMRQWIAAIQNVAHPRSMLRASSDSPVPRESNMSSSSNGTQEPRTPKDVPSPVASPEPSASLKLSTSPEKEKTMASLKGHEYDVVFDISSISGLPTTPWPVNLSSDKYGLFKNSMTGADSAMRGSIVSVVGLYNKGKTLVINNLSDAFLPSGSKITTRGLSFVCPPAFDGSMVFLDTAGTHSPVQVHSEDALLDRRATELLVQDLVFDLADYFLVVVQDLTWPDQEFIQGLVSKLNASQKHFKQVIVIHNFRDTEDVQDALDHWKLQVIKSYPMGEQILRPVTLNDKRTVNAIFYASKAVRHVFIAKEGSNAGHEFNAATFQLLKSWLYDIVVEAGKELRPMEKVLGSVNNHLKNYIDEGCKAVKYNSKDGELFMELVDSNFDLFKLRPFTLGWISPKFETGEFVPAIDTWVGEGWICTMDVPGVSISSVRVITRNWPILRIEGERLPVVFEDFKLERSERKFSPFSATMKVNPSLDPRSKEVNVVDGVLTLKFKYYDDLDGGQDF